MLAQQAYEKLRHAIYRGALMPGRRIVERDLARRFRISRIPLRESLARLQAEGLIRNIPYSSSYVEDLEPSDVLEIYSLRLLFEPLATRLAALRRPAALIRRLENYCERMKLSSRRVSPIELDRIDYAFHHAIVIACGHRRLVRGYEAAHIRVVSTRTDLAIPAAMAPDEAAEAHLGIVARIRAGDADGAEQIARRHVERSIRMLHKVLGATLEDIPPGGSRSTASGAGRNSRKLSARAG